jgi:hypothetical protein
MVHGITLYACGHERCRCPCQRSHDHLTLKLPDECPDCGGPSDNVPTYEEYDHVLDGGKT